MARDAAKTYGRVSNRVTKRIEKRQGGPLNDKQRARVDRRAGRRTERKMNKSRGQEYTDKHGNVHEATGTGTHRPERKTNGKKGYKSTAIKTYAEGRDASNPYGPMPQAPPPQAAPPPVAPPPQAAPPPAAPLPGAALPVQPQPQPIDPMVAQMLMGAMGSKPGMGMVR